MSRNGFTLVELMITVFVIAVLLGISTLKFGQMSKKSGIDAQTRMLYADLMTVRNEALTRKKGRAVTFDGAQFKAYSSQEALGKVMMQRTLKYPMLPATVTTIYFDTLGVATWSASGNVYESLPICVDPMEDSAAYDSLILSRTRIKMAKRKSGAECTYNDYSAGKFVTK